jgi:hypothetical protein
MFYFACSWNSSLLSDQNLFEEYVYVIFKVYYTRLQYHTVYWKLQQISAASKVCHVVTAEKSNFIYPT